MTLSNFIPKLSSKNKSVKDLVVEVLSDGWSLTTKELHSKIKRDSSKNVSYQAVHKVLLELEDEGVLEKQGKSFTLSKKWIHNMKEFVKNLDKLESNSSLQLVEKEKGKNFTVKFDDFSKFCIDFADWLIKKDVPLGVDPSPMSYMDHFIWPPRFNFTDFYLVVKMAKTAASGIGIYALSRSDSVFDEWIMQQYLKGGFKGVKIGEKSLPHGNIAVKGNTVIEFTFTEESKKIMDKYYSEISNIQDLFKFYLSDPKAHQIQLTATFTHNPAMAELVRRQILSYFPEAKK